MNQGHRPSTRTRSQTIRVLAHSRPLKGKTVTRKVLQILEQVARGDVDPATALESIQCEPFVQLAEGISLDLHREVRTGQGEVVLGLRKSPGQLVEAVRGLSGKQRPVLVTKLDKEQGDHLENVFPEGTFWPQAGLFALGKDLGLAPPWDTRGEVLVVSAGSSDLSVALEALGTARFYGLEAGLVPDVGVAGLHRLLPHLQAIRASRALIVVAGMEGALPSVMGGLVDKPIVAVPTSVGYGASLGGLSALLGMLNTCSPGVGVVNIDNGFGAAALVKRFLETAKR